MLLPEGTQQRDVTGALRTEAEVAADEDEPGVQRVDEDLGHERLGRLRLQFLVEAEQQGRVDPGVLEQFAALRGARQGRRDVRRVDDVERVAVERDDCRHEVVLAGGALEVRDDGSVPDVHAVELADGDGARPEPVRHVGGVLVELHGGSYSLAGAVVEDAAGADGSVPAVRWCLRSHQSPAIGSTSGAKA